MVSQVPALPRLVTTAKLLRLAMPQHLLYLPPEPTFPKFFELPLEIRDTIYYFFFANIADVLSPLTFYFGAHDIPHRRSSHRNWDILAILTASKAIHTEAKAILWSQIQFETYPFLHHTADPYRLGTITGWVKAFGTYGLANLAHFSCNICCKATPKKIQFLDKNDPCQTTIDHVTKGIMDNLPNLKHLRLSVRFHCERVVTYADTEVASRTLMRALRPVLGLKKELSLDLRECVGYGECPHSVAIGSLDYACAVRVVKMVREELAEVVTLEPY